jgi:hypothetical protein
LLPPGLPIGTVVEENGKYRVALLADAASSEDVEVLAFRKPPEQLPATVQLPSEAAGLPPATATPPAPVANAAAPAAPASAAKAPSAPAMTSPQPSVSSADQPDEDR